MIVGLVAAGRGHAPRRYRVGPAWPGRRTAHEESVKRIGGLPVSGVARTQPDARFPVTRSVMRQTSVTKSVILSNPVGIVKLVQPALRPPCGSRCRPSHAEQANRRSAGAGAAG